MASRLLLPLLNRKVITFPGPTWYLSEKVCVETISSEDFGPVLSFAPEEYKSLLSSKTKCIRIELADEELCQETCLKEATKTAFILNFFKTSQPIALAFAVHLIRKRKIRFDRIIDLPVVADLQFQRKHNYHVKDRIARGAISQFYQIISHVADKQPTILITLGNRGDVPKKTRNFRGRQEGRP